MGIATDIPGFLFFDHVAVSVKLGDLEKQVAVYKAMKFKEIHRDDVRERSGA
jgi:methylmalonyl-CoA/ethylmalonyl-CoA epimerase